MSVPRSPSGRKKASAVVVNPEAIDAFVAALEGRGWTPLAELQAILEERHPDRSWTENAAGRVARAAIKAKKVAVVDIRRFHYYAPVGFSGPLPETNEGRVLRAVAAGHRSARDIAAYIHGGPMAISAAVANLVAAGKLKKGPRGQCYLATEEIPVPPELVAALDTLKSLPRPASAPHLAGLARCDPGTMLGRMRALHDLGLVIRLPTTKGDEWTPAKLKSP